MTKLTTSIIATLASIAGFSGQASAQATAYGLNTGGLTFQTFDVSTPGSILQTSTFSNFSTIGETIVSIDFRPANSALYGYSSANNLYTINLSTGALTEDTAFGVNVLPGGTTVGTGSDTASATNLNNALAPVSIDVNPNVPAGGAVGALRIVDTSGNNLRYTFAAPNNLFTDDTLTITGGGVPQVVGVAYTNNDIIGGTGTSLFYIDTSTDTLYTTAAPNDGLLILPGTSAVGNLGITLGTDVGFDIPLFDTTNTAFLTSGNSLYTVNLTTGVASLSGTIGGATVTDIAVAPEPSTNLLLLLGGVGTFVMLRRARSRQA